jgi:hypothetical protein
MGARCGATRQALRVRAEEHSVRDNCEVETEFVGCAAPRVMTIVRDLKLEVTTTDRPRRVATREVS